MGGIPLPDNLAPIAPVNLDTYFRKEEVESKPEPIAFSVPENVTQADPATQIQTSESGTDSVNWLMPALIGFVCILAVVFVFLILRKKRHSF